MSGTPAVIALGSNLGDRLGHLAEAVSQLAASAGVGVVAVSPVYESAPVGGPAQPDYLNAVLLVTATVSPRELLRQGQAIEAAHHRVRAERWGPRTLDLDLIAYGDVRSADAELTLPHPRAHERAFVLAPWADVAPAAELAGRGRVVDLLAASTAGPNLPAAGVRRRDDLVLPSPRPLERT